MAANRKIQLSGDPNARYDEAVASVTIKPGMLAKIGTDGRIAPSTVAGALIPQRIVTEQLNTLQGKTVDDAYPVGESVSYWYPQSGDHANLLLAAEQNVAIGTMLISTTDGTFIATTGSPALTGWQSIEALDLTGDAAALVRAVRI